MRFSLRQLLLFVAALSLVLTAYRWWPVDGIIGNLFAYGGHDTVWATGFSDHGWRAIRVGMRREEVYALVGPPIENATMPGGQGTEYWTRSPGDTNYFQRSIEFNRDRVVDKSSQFWLD